jgi:hypothetical protein
MDVNTDLSTPYLGTEVFLNMTKCYGYYRLEADTIYKRSQPSTSMKKLKL